MSSSTLMTPLTFFRSLTLPEGNDPATTPVAGRTRLTFIPLAASWSATR